MREILFRGQTRKYGQNVNLKGEKLSGKWVYGGILSGECDYSIIYGSEFEDMSAKDIEKYSVYSDTVGQYTGLVDKNDKRIFEGDILHAHDSLLRPDCPYHEFDGVVEFRNGSFVIVSDLITHYRWLDYDVEIIGNIYDNPELLEED